MTSRIFSYSIIGAVVLVAVCAGAWYVIAPPNVSRVAFGHIEGTTLYPSEGIPAQRVCAQNISDTHAEYCTDAPETAQETQPTFSITVPPGNYNVYATLKDANSIGSDFAGYKAYYTEYVRCGMRYECADHTKIQVTVSAGQTVSDIYPHDWYMPQ